MISAFLVAGIGLCPGDVITVSDSNITFPLNPARAVHQRRFCLVLSNDFICSQSEIISIAPMTSDIATRAHSDVVLAATPQNGLLVPSRILLNQIQPIRKSAVTAKMGKLSVDDWESVMAKIFWNFDRA